MSLQDDINNLQSVITQNSGSAINDFSGAVQNMQSAGNNAVGNIGPAIDQLSDSNPQVMQITQFAWQENGKLAGITSDNSVSQDDVNQAASILKQMASQYGQAYRLALSLQQTKAANPAPSPHVSPNQSPAVTPTTNPVISNPQTSGKKKFGLPKMGVTEVGIGLGAVVGFAFGGPIGGAGGALVGGAIGSLLKGKV